MKLLGSRERMQIFTTNYGRLAGWWVVKQNQRLLELSDPASDDMFWVSYRVSSMASVDWKTMEFWERGGTSIHSKLNGQKIETWLVSPRFADDRVILRGLYLDPGFPEFPWPWERWMMRYPGRFNR